MAEFEEIARTQGDGWRVPYPLPVTDTRPRTDGLLKPVQQPLAVMNAQTRALPRTYIYCSEKPDIRPDDAFVATAKQAQADAAWRYRELPTGHAAVWTMPQELTDLLLEIA